MTDNAEAPFSARNRGAHKHIDNEFPDTARTGLLHLLCRLVDKDYVNGWSGVAREMERLARLKPREYDNSQDARDAAELALSKLPWDRVFDFCERLYSYLPEEVWHWDSRTGENALVSTRNEAQEYVMREVRLLFLEEHLGYDFEAGTVRRRGRKHTHDRISRAELVLGDPRLAKALRHFNKAIKFFRQVSRPDPENAVKEAVCAVEATARALFPEANGPTLGDVIKGLTGGEAGQLPKPIAQTFHGLYGFRSGGDGVGHGGGGAGPATKELAEYSMAVAASQIVLLVDLANSQEADVPF